MGASKPPPVGIGGVPPLLLLLVVRAGNGGPRRKRDPSARHPLFFSPKVAAAAAAAAEDEEGGGGSRESSKNKGLSRLLSSIERTGGRISCYALIRLLLQSDGGEPSRGNDKSDLDFAPLLKLLQPLFLSHESRPYKAV